MRIETGEAPQAWPANAAPDAIFLGGDVGNDALFDGLLDALKPGGRLVANAVTLDGEAALFARQAQLGGELVRIDVERARHASATERVLRPRMAVTQWALDQGGTMSGQPVISSASDRAIPNC